MDHRVKLLDKLGWQRATGGRQSHSERVSPRQDVIQPPVENGMAINPNSEKVMMNGVMLRKGTDYRISSDGREIILNETLDKTETITVEYSTGVPLISEGRTEVLLLPRQIGETVFSQEALEEMLKDCVGRNFKPKTLQQYNPTLGLDQLNASGYIVEEAWIGPNGLVGYVKVVQ